MRVADYPRPRGDNGLGLNWSSSPHHPRGNDLDPWLSELDSMSIKWVRVLDDGRGSSLALCRRLLSSNMMPVVSFWRDTPSRNTLTKRELQTAGQLASIGVQYFETHRLPDVSSSWPGGVVPKDWQDITAQAYVRNADALLEAGCLPGVPALSPGSPHNLVRAIIARGRGDLFEKGAWLAMHNPTVNRPIRFPDDDICRTGRALSTEEYFHYAQWAHGGIPYQDLAARGIELSEVDYYKYSNWAWDWRSSAVVSELRALDANPAQTVCDDRKCFRAWEALSESTVGAIGFSVPIITTEGGTAVGADEDRRYPRVNPLMQAAWTLEIARFMRDEAPPWYLACCSSAMAASSLGHSDPAAERFAWYTTAWDQQFGLSGELPVVQALKDEALGSGSLTGTIRTLAGREIGGLTLDLAGETTQPRSSITGNSAYGRSSAATSLLAATRSAGRDLGAACRFQR